MTTTAPRARIQRVDASKMERTEAIRQLHRDMYRCVASSTSRSSLLRRFIEVLGRFAKPQVVYFFEHLCDEPVGAHCLLSAVSPEEHTRCAQQLEAQCRIASRRGEIDVRRLAAPARVQMAVPLPSCDDGSAAFGLVVAGDTPSDELLLVVQTLSGHVAQSIAITDGHQARIEARDAAAIVELTERLASAHNLRSGCYDLVANLQSHLECERVVIALRRRGKGRCQVAAISGVARFDKRSVQVQALEAALDETTLRAEIIVWPPFTAELQRDALTHKQLCHQDDVAAVASAPLTCKDGKNIGAVITLHKSVESLPATEQFLRMTAPPLAHSLDAAQRLEGGLLAKVLRSTRRSWKTVRGRVLLAGVLLLFACLAIPLPYKVGCPCRLEPVTRRFVVAPFSGTLEKSLVKPGDIVQERQILAQMDGREIHWRRASLAADRDRASKKRVAAQASHDYTEQQIAALEIERLDVQLRLLDHRADNLQIKSPLAGIVTTGDLQRAEGAPLQTGASLFEIAPLEKMIVEVAVPDDCISHIRAGQPVEIRLDAFPGEVWRTTLAKIHPRSEIRDDCNVFIAEAVLDNRDRRIRPGSQGRAKITTPYRALGWILFHRPWEYLSRL